MPLLLLDRSLSVEPSPTPAAVYVCEAVALVGPAPTTLLLARRTAGTEAVALWWIRLRAERMTHHLHPALARPVWAWLADSDEQRSARAIIGRGQPYTLRIHDGEAEHLLTVKTAGRSALALDPSPDLQVTT